MTYDAVGYCPCPEYGRIAFEYTREPRTFEYLRADMVTHDVETGDDVVCLECGYHLAGTEITFEEET